MCVRARKLIFLCVSVPFFNNVKENLNLVIEFWVSGFFVVVLLFDQVSSCPVLFLYSMNAFVSLQSGRIESLQIF